MIARMIIPHRTRVRLLWAALAALLLGPALAGCVYRMDIQQGNFLTGKSVDKLEVGMTRAQVRYLLGTPMLPDVFDKDRWDYLFYYQHAHNKPRQRHLVVFFKEDKVEHFVRENVPEAPPQAPDQGAPIEKFPKI